MAPIPTKRPFSERASGLSFRLERGLEKSTEAVKSVKSYRQTASILGETAEAKSASVSLRQHQRALRRTSARLKKVKALMAMKDGVYAGMKFDNVVVRGVFQRSLLRPEFKNDVIRAEKMLSLGPLSGFKSGAAYRKVLADSEVNAGAQEYIDAVRYMEFLASEAARKFPREEFPARMQRNFVRLRGFLSGSG